MKIINGVIICLAFLNSSYFSQAHTLDEMTDINNEVVYLKTDSSLFTGKVKDYYPNGYIKLSAHFNEGYRHGRFIKWHSNHRKFLFEHYKNGYKHGICKKVDINGRLMYRKKYHLGEMLWEKDFIPVTPSDHH